METVESEDAAKRYLLDLAGVPIHSWKPRPVSEDGKRVDIWISQFTSDALKEHEEAGAYFTAERGRVVRIGAEKQAA